ncbi:hypothetical protein [Nostoc sp.]|uniref:hypothetical protein n=1 Tax=Nostoc sp. TaxID=1180 RepID=UPI002FFC1667
MTSSESSKQHSLSFVNYTSEEWKDLQATHYNLMGQSVMAIKVNSSNKITIAVGFDFAQQTE